MDDDRRLGSFALSNDLSVLHMGRGRNLQPYAWFEGHHVLATTCKHSCMQVVQAKQSKANQIYIF